MYVVTPRSQAEVNQIVSFLHSNPEWEDLRAPKNELFRVGQTAIFWKTDRKWYTPFAYEETLLAANKDSLVHLKVNELHTLSTL